MITLYYAKTDQLPPRENLLRSVRLNVETEKRDAWLQQSELRARESLSGILLLQRGLEQANLMPEDEILCFEAQGRPYLQSGNVDFSISHTNGITVCAVMTAAEGRVGVDVERSRERNGDSMKRIADRWFTQGERKLFLENSVEAQFLEIWTGKEALSKQQGGGLGVLARCDVTDLSEDARLKAYRVEECYITLCCPSSETPPHNVVRICL